MATVSARVDDRLKEEAERVADSIGISLSTAINIFLRKFTAEQGFPFPVKAQEGRPPAPRFDAEALTAMMRQAIADPDNTGISPHFTYFDETSQKPVTIYNRKE